MAKPVSTTETAAALLASGVLLALLRAVVRSHLFATPQGLGAMTDLLGVLLTTFTIFGVLAIQGLASGSSRARELEDGLAGLAASAWAFALVPPRPENYLLVGAPDDFIYAQVPMALAVGVAVRVLSALSRDRTPFALTQRHGLLTALGLAMLGLCVLASGGPGSLPFCLRALGFAIASALLSAASRLRRKA
jgi:hypothetical protein